MARRPRCRKVCRLPISASFVPETPGENKEEIVLIVEEYEAMRLIDREGFTQEACGKYMDVARTTAQQIYADARKKVTADLVEGRTLRIKGGAYRPLRRTGRILRVRRSGQAHCFGQFSVFCCRLCLYRL